MAVVLVIDDNAPVRALIRRVLEAAGHYVLDADNGRTGLRLFQEYAPALVITDLFMPEQDGIEVLLATRKLDRSSKVLAISGGGTLGVPSLILEQAQDLGADKTLKKPFSNEDLTAAVASLLAS